MTSVSTNPSVMIPRVFPNIGERRIRGVFNSLDLGEIDHIDFVEREAKNGDKFNMVFIHFKQWFDNKSAAEAKAQLLGETGEPLIVEYDTPWFWKVYLNKGKKHERVERKAPKLILNSASAEPKSGKSHANSPSHTSTSESSSPFPPNPLRLQIPDSP